MLVAVGALGLVGPLARSALSERAKERGLTSDVGAVRPGLRGVWLRDVTLASPAPSRVTARIDAVLVPYGGAPLEIHGARVTVRGTPDEIKESVRAKRSGSAEATGRRRELLVDGVDIVWSELTERGTTQFVWGLSLERSQTEDRLRWDRADLGEKGLRIALRDGNATLGPGAKLTAAKLRSLEMALELARHAESLPPVPAAVVRASAPANPAAPAVAALVAVARERLGAALVTGAKLEVEAASARLGFGKKEELGFGPSRVVLTRDDRELKLAVSPAERAAPGSTPLSMGLHLPLAGGEPSLEIEGGPVGLGVLGVREGDLGLRRVREATLEAHLRVELAPGSSALRGSGSGKLVNLSLFRPALAPEELRGLAAGFRVAGEASLDGSRLAIDDAELAVGDVRLAFTLSAERGDDGLHVRSKGGVPLASCSAMLGSLPKELVAELDGLVLEGTFTLAYELDYLATKPNATRVVLDVKNDCRVKSAPAAFSPNRFRSIWVREVKGEGGQSVMIQSGPGTPEWVPYAEIARNMEIAVLVCEDGGFYRHRGFDFRAIEKALNDDIRAGRFVRGASTISMQLAKNLYLGREKTLSRKIQEALLTMLLEQELSKQELMELYLNVVELGPGIYGVGPAAQHYFKVRAKDLTLGQALYLASILPDPTRQHFTPEGDVTERWAEYLKKLMRIARKVERISDEELEVGLAESVGFRKGGIPPTDAGESADASDLEGAVDDDVHP